MTRALYAACLAPLLRLPLIAAVVGISLALLLPFALLAAVLVASAAWALAVWRNEALRGQARGALLRPRAAIPLLLAAFGCGSYVQLAPFETEATVLSVGVPSAPAPTPGFRAVFVLSPGDGVPARATLILDRAPDPDDVHRLFVVPDPLLRGPPRYVYLGPKRS